MNKKLVIIAIFLFSAGATALLAQEKVIAEGHKILASRGIVPVR